MALSDKKLREMRG